MVGKWSDLRSVKTRLRSGELAFGVEDGPPHQLHGGRLEPLAGHMCISSSAYTTRMRDAGDWLRLRLSWLMAAGSVGIAACAAGCGGRLDGTGSSRDAGNTGFVCPSGAECGPRTCRVGEVCQSTAQCGCCVPPDGGFDCLASGCGVMAAIDCQGTQCVGYVYGPAGSTILACCLPGGGCGLTLPSGGCMEPGPMPPSPSECGSYAACLAERGGCTRANDCACGQCRCDWEALRNCTSPGFCKIAQGVFNACLATAGCPQ